MSIRDLRTKLQGELIEHPIVVRQRSNMAVELGDPSRVGRWNTNRAGRADNIYLVCARQNHNVHS
jgi:hypothetical protein